MKNRAIFSLLLAFTLCGCKSPTSFQASPAEFHNGGPKSEQFNFEMIEGIPVWIKGAPGRPFTTFGVITDRERDVPEHYDYPAAIERIACLAKRKHAQGVIIVSRIDPTPPSKSASTNDDLDDDDNFFGRIALQSITLLFKATFSFLFSGDTPSELQPIEVIAVPIIFPNTNGVAAQKL